MLVVDYIEDAKKKIREAASEVAETLVYTKKPQLECCKAITITCVSPVTASAG